MVTKKSFALFLALGLCFSTEALADAAIYDVVKNEDMDTFSDMVVLGYDIDEKDADGYTPLMIASAMGKEKFVRFLLNNNAKVNKRSYFGTTALHRAAQAGNNVIVNMLVDAGALVNMPDLEGNTPLIYAVKAEKLFTVELLINLGADVNFINAKGETALRWAQKKRFKGIIDFLKAHGAE